MPPPTRGWPFALPVERRTSGGAPAHAGMAPPLQTGPLLHATVPPPTRGWPAATDAARERLAGAPAHAGMAPSSTAPRA